MTSSAELLLAVQLDRAHILYRREVRFSPPRKWRADFSLTGPRGRILVEVEGGSFTGGHKRGKAYESDCDKNNAAMDLGWKVYRFTPAMVDDGRALKAIQRALGLENDDAAA